jgi:drug/metabolite transporter (DMT)-like permease
MWILWAVLSAALFTYQGLLSRHVLRNQPDAWAYSLFFSAVGALVTLPFMLAAPTIPTSWQPWAIGALVGAIIVSHNWLWFQAARHLEASLSGAIQKIRLVWVFVFSVLVLGTAFSWSTLLGTILTVAAGVVIIRGLKQPKSLTGVYMVLGTTFLYAAIIILYKYLGTSFNAVSLTFFVAFLIPAIMNFVLIPRAAARSLAVYRKDGRNVVLACVTGALANVALIQGLAVGEPTGVVVITEVFLIFTLVGEHLWLKERSHLALKLSAVLLATVGAVLIVVGA